MCFLSCFSCVFIRLHTSTGRTWLFNILLYFQINFTDKKSSLAPPLQVSFSSPSFILPFHKSARAVYAPHAGSSSFQPLCYTFFHAPSILPPSSSCPTLVPALSLLFCRRSTSSISYTLISKVSAVAAAPRRLEGAGGPSGPSTQHAPGLDEEDEEDVMVCLEER